MPSLSSAFDTPIAVTIDGEAFKLPILTVDDLLSLGRDVLNERRDAELRPLSIADRAGKQAVIAFYESAELGIDDLAKMTGTLTGSRRFVAASAKKGGIADPDAFVAKLGKTLGYQAMVNLAALISGIWPIVRKQEDESPNADAADGQAESAASPKTETSSPSDSPSGSDTASTPAA